MYARIHMYLHVYERGQSYVEPHMSTNLPNQYINQLVVLCIDCTETCGILSLVQKPGSHQRAVVVAFSQSRCSTVDAASVSHQSQEGTYTQRISFIFSVCCGGICLVVIAAYI